MRLAAGVVALPSVSRVARADTYPAKPVRLMNGFAAGGTADIFARLMGQWLSERLGQQFLTENRTGAASNIATEAVIRAPADGYTLLLATPANAINDDQSPAIRQSALILAALTTLAHVSVSSVISLPKWAGDLRSKSIPITWQHSCPE
jgi:tripartite-type tricarboxylate transporter receptor subunit TctC